MKEFLSPLQPDTYTMIPAEEDMADSTCTTGAQGAGVSQHLSKSKLPKRRNSTGVTNQVFQGGLQKRIHSTSAMENLNKDGPPRTGFMENLALPNPNMCCRHLSLPLTPDMRDMDKSALEAAETGFKLEKFLGIPIEPEPVRMHSVSVGRRVFSVTNYGDVDINACPVCDMVGENVQEDSTEKTDPTVQGLNIPVVEQKFPKRKHSSSSSFQLLPVHTEVEESTEHTLDTREDQNANQIQVNGDIPWKDQYQNPRYRARHSLSLGDVEEASPYRRVSKRERHSQILISAARMARLFTKRKQGRIVNKRGECNLNFINVRKKRLKYVADMFTTFLEIKWRYTIVIFFLSYVFTWFFFAFIWWGLYAGYQNEGEKCMVGVYNFPSALLFSIETQHTIGYGTRAVTDSCPVATIILMLQSSIGVLSQCIATGIVFAKLAKPKRRAHTVMFSERAVISRTDGNFYLSFRVGNMRHRQLMGTSIKAMLVKTKLTAEGELICFFHEHLDIATEGADDFYLLAWPIVVMHKIDAKSPLWNMSPEELMIADVEIIVVLEASCEATGGSIQVRTSYLPSEIQWGYKLAPLMTKYKVDSMSGRYNVDFTQFNKTEPFDTPDCSPAEAADRRNSKIRFVLVNEEADEEEITA